MRYFNWILFFALMVSHPNQALAQQSRPQPRDKYHGPFFITPNISYHSALKGTIGLTAVIGKSIMGFEGWRSFKGVFIQPELGLGGFMCNLGYGAYLGGSKLAVFMPPAISALSGAFSYLHTQDDPLNASKNSTYYGAVFEFVLLVRLTVGVYVKDFEKYEESTLFTASLGCGF